MFICFITCVCTQFTPGYLEGSTGNTEKKWRPNSYHERFDFIDDQVRQLLQVMATTLTSSRFCFCFFLNWSVHAERSHLILHCRLTRLTRSNIRLAALSTGISQFWHYPLPFTALVHVETIIFNFIFSFFETKKKKNKKAYFSWRKRPTIWRQYRKYWGTMSTPGHVRASLFVWVE